MRNQIYSILVCVTAFILLGTATAGAEVPIPPNTTIRIVVPYSAGGGYDVYARLMAPHFQAALEEMGARGVKVVVNNVTGGGGSIATTQVYNAKPNGETVLLLDPETSLWQQMLQDAKFDIGKFSYFGQQSVDPLALVVNSQAKIDTFDQFVERSNKQPILIGTCGRGNYDHIYPIMLQSALRDQGIDVKFEYLHNAGVAQILAGMRRGESEATTEVITSFLGAEKEGHIKYLFTLTHDRSPLLPETPTFGEVVGQAMAKTLDDLIVSANFHRVYVLPPGTDEKVVNFYAKALKKAIEKPELLEQAKTANRPMTFASSSDVAKMIGQMIQLAEKYKEIVKSEVDR